MTFVTTRKGVTVLMAGLLAGCATVPTGPSVAVMPGPGKSFEQFQADDHVCRTYADQSAGINANQSGSANVAAGAAVGTALGAVAGGLIGGNRGVGTGAGMGLILGTAEGAGNASQSERDVQRRYDIAYEQCMSAKGNQLPQTLPPTSYYRYRGHRPPVVIYQPPPTVIYQQGAPESAPPPPPSSPPPPPPPPAP